MVLDMIPIFQVKDKYLRQSYTLQYVSEFYLIAKYLD